MPNFEYGMDLFKVKQINFLLPDAGRSLSRFQVFDLLSLRDSFLCKGSSFEFFSIS